MFNPLSADLWANLIFPWTPLAGRLKKIRKENPGKYDKVGEFMDGAREFLVGKLGIKVMGDSHGEVLEKTEEELRKKTAELAGGSAGVEGEGSEVE